MQLAHERAGTYDVGVEMDGYRRWRSEDVVVKAGRCHVQTVSLTALLHPDG